jgi:hypothetical protein
MGNGIIKKKMAVCNTVCYMPIEILDLIAAVDELSYRAMLAIPLFTRSLSPGKVVDFMIAFGYSVDITKNYIECLLNGKRHRVDGPAIEYANGNKEWRMFGKLHRSPRRGEAARSSDPVSSGGEPVGPAMETASGYKAWFLNGKRHRIDGPAIEYANGDKQWFLNGKQHRSSVGPAVEFANGHKEWYLNGKLHRVGGPAVEYANGDKGWLLNGNLHRNDGPAMEFANGNKVWYLNGIRQRDQ